MLISTTRKYVREFYVLNYLNHLVAGVLGHASWPRSSSADTVLWLEELAQDSAWEVEQGLGDPASTTQQCASLAPQFLRL